MVVIESEKYREGKMATGLQTDSRSDTSVKRAGEVFRKRSCASSYVRAETEGRIDGER